ncbi:FAD-dependent monooxygenase [Streptomyces sp. RK9]|uniref:FAD-dependent monooxygenase n=1 Tax=Streptomyces sp. RK9 TaxID=3239284 RepID=UPI0038640311
MRIAVIGGGPGGLYFSALARRLDPGHEITVWERNAPDETFGFGVVLSDQALNGIERADPAVLSEMRPMLTRWDDIDVHYRGTTFTAGGNGFAAMSRAGLLLALQRRCAQLGIPVRHGSEATDVDALAADHDVVVAADGANSLVRERYAETFRPTVRTGTCRYIWLGTDLELDSFAFHVLDTPGGAAQVHAYPDSRHAGTLILELSESAWHAAGFATATAPRLAPGESDERSIGIIAELCKDILNGQKLYGNNSRWLRFPTVRCDTWSRGNVVLIGDAAHTAHFSVGSGTKLAMEDALALARNLCEQPRTEAALAAYEAERRPAVGSLQRAARASREWFENVDRYTHQEPQQFAVNLLTRSRRVSCTGLRRRDPEFTARAERWFADAAGGEGAGGQVRGEASPPMLQPFTLGRLEVVNRVVASPGPGVPARDGVPGDLELVHLGGAALGGAGLVLTGPVAVSATGRAGPGGAGLYSGEQAVGWRRVVDFVHTHSPAKIGVRLGHYGPDGSAEALGELRRAFAAAARRAAGAGPGAPGGAGFDLLELDCAHGSLGTSHRRLRHPLDVFDAIRAVWPDERPLGVRICPARWFPDGDGVEAVVRIANEFAARGATAVHVCAGTRADRDGYADPDAYADRIRNQAGGGSACAVIASGSIPASDVDTIVLAGRADLCVVDRPTMNSPWRFPHGTPDRATSQEWS